MSLYNMRWTASSKMENRLIPNRLRCCCRQLQNAVRACFSHKARHNFGTHITLSMGVPIETVSRMMGHKSITTTQIYAKVTDKKVGEDMKGLKMRTKDRKIVLCEEDVSVMKKKRARSDREKAAFA